MSLINDALKRASAPRPPNSDAPAVPVMQPVTDAPRGAGPLPIVLFIVGVGALLVSGAFWLKSKGTPRTTAALPETTKTVTAAPAALTAAVPIETLSTNLSLPTVTTTIQTPAPVVPEPVAVAAAKVVEPVEQKPVVKSPAVVTAPAPKPVVVEDPAPAVEPPAPDLNLQAIYYRMKGPTVVINGRTLKVGEVISGAKLVIIERNAAIVEFQGTHRRLTIK